LLIVVSDALDIIEVIDVEAQGNQEDTDEREQRESVAIEVLLELFSNDGFQHAIDLLAVVLPISQAVSGSDFM
jgi:hypothetical protein